ncbi:MAG: UPF0182 family protein [Candidatus Poribacteria bacterium]|nr:UPF0182 family protein [Candidatus Poribacteria bacterium]
MINRSRRLTIIGGVLFALWILSRVWTAYVPDVWWFQSLSGASGSNYTAVFTKIVWTKVALGVAMRLILLAMSVGNVWLVHRLAPRAVHRSVQGALPWDVPERDLRVYFQKILYGASVAFSIALGWASTAQWEVWQRWFNSTGISFKDADGSPILDPLFGKNVGYYILKLPFEQFLSGWFLAIVLPIALISTAVYFFYGGIYNDRNRLDISRPIGVHLGSLGALTFIALAWRHRLSMYELLFTSQNKFYGAGYVEVHARLPILWILLVLCIIAAVVFLVSVLRNRLAPAFYVTLLYFVVVIVGGGFYPGIVGQLKVKPNEQNLQREYIAHNIEMTRRAFGLDKIELKPYDASGDALALSMVQKPEIIENVRLWDPRPLMEVYQQSQELRPQYDFADVDIDRYNVGGIKRQVTIAARELETAQLTQGAQTWVNKTFNFTHGYGVVVGPVNAVQEGKPHYYLKDIPLATETGWTHPISETPGPRIYYGERTDNYVVVNPNNTEAVEFDYPIEGEQFAKYTYTGNGGVPMDSFLRRLTYALKFKEYNFLLSDQVKRGSRVMYDREVMTRVQRIAPFLKFDPDPYLVLSEGRLVWMVDAYMTTYRYPYSQPLEDSYRNFIIQTRGRQAATRVLPRGIPWGNYLRNSVKVTVDAYDGSVNLYRLDTDPTLGVDDPLLECYAEIFPTLFKPFSAMPETLKQHMRYPRTLFWLQATQLCSYHMTDPDTFYLDEDLWDLTYEIYEEETQPVEPYYVTMSLPGETTAAEFMLIYPFAPHNKLVMSAWMAARCDYRTEGGRQYGEISIYRFPKGSQMFGPEQWESEFLANEEFSNWKKVQSADVRRGNLLLFPFEQGMLAIEPIYLRSPAAPIPMLRQVMAGYVVQSPTGNQTRSVMGLNLTDALSKLLGGVASIPAVLTESSEPAPTAALPAETNELIGEAQSAYDAAQSALRQGKWTEYGQNMEKLDRILKRLGENARR